MKKNLLIIATILWFASALLAFSRQKNAYGALFAILGSITGTSALVVSGSREQSGTVTPTLNYQGVDMTVAEYDRLRRQHTEDERKAALGESYTTLPEVFLIYTFEQWDGHEDVLIALKVPPLELDRMMKRVYPTLPAGSRCRYFRTYAEVPEAYRRQIGEM